MSNSRWAWTLSAFFLLGMVTWWLWRALDRTPLPATPTSITATVSTPTPASAATAQPPIAVSDSVARNAATAGASTPAATLSPDAPRFAFQFLRSEDNTPVAGAEVSYRLGISLYDYAQGTVPMPEPTVVGESDAGGFITFPAPPIRTSFNLLVHAEGRAPIRLMTGPKRPDEETTATTVLLPPPVSIAGIVVDENDAPVPGAIVGDPINGLVVSDPDLHLTGAGHLLCGLDHAISGEDGRFTITRAPKAKELKLYAHSKGRLRSAQVTVTDPTQPVKLVLPGGRRTISGRVQFADGRPDPGARVTLSTAKASPEAARSFDAGTMRVLTIADATGRFALVGVPDGFITCTAFSVQDSRYSVIKDIGADEEPASVLLSYPPDETIRGRVVDAETNRGIAAIRIVDTNPRYRLASTATSPESSTITDANGAFALRVPGRQGGDQLLYAILPPPWLPAPPTGEEAQGFTRVDPHEGNIVLSTRRPAGEESDMLLRLSAGALLKGRVVRGAERRAVPNATLSIAPPGKGGENRAGGGSDALAQSRSDGTFTMPIPRVLPAFDIVAVATGGARGHVAISLPESGNPGDVEIALREGASLAGVLIDADGKPAASYPLGAQPAVSSRPHVTAPFSARTKTDGTFHFTALPAGNHLIVQQQHQGSVPESVSGAMPEFRVDLAEGEHRTGVEIRLVRGREISGFVRDTELKPIAGATVTAFYVAGAPTGSLVDRKTDDEGFYHFDSIPPDAVVNSISAKATGYETQSKSGVAVSSLDVDFVLEQALAYRLVVRDESGTPVRHFIARWGHRNGLGRELIHLDPRQRKVVRDSADGTVPLESGLESRQVVFQVAEIDEAEKLTGRAGIALMDSSNDPEGLRGNVNSRIPEIPVTLRTTAPLRGIVRNGSAPASGATVVVNHADSYGASFRGPSDVYPESAIFRLPTLTAGEDGTFEWPMAPQGAYELTAKLGSLQTSEAVPWQSTGIAHSPLVELQLAPARAVVGTVTGLDGAPMAGIEVKTYGSSNGTRAATTRTDREGSYRLETVLGDDVTVRFELGDLGVDEASAETPETGDVRIDLDLRGRVKVTVRGTVAGSPIPTREHPRAQLLIPNSRGSGKSSRDLQGKGSGTWACLAPPGEYWVRIPTNTWGISHFAGPFQVATEPPEQEFRFDFDTHEVDLLLLLPGDAEPAQSVQVTLVQRCPVPNADMDRGTTLRMERRSQRVAGIPSGEYELRIGGWRYPAGPGPKSGWVTIGPGQENVIVLEIDDPKKLYPNEGL